MARRCLLRPSARAPAIEGLGLCYPLHLSATSSTPSAGAARTACRGEGGRVCAATAQRSEAHRLRARGSARGARGGRAPTRLTTSTATQIAMPSVHACSSRCAGTDAPMMVDTCAPARRSPPCARLPASTQCRPPACMHRAPCCSRCRDCRLCPPGSATHGAAASTCARSGHGPAAHARALAASLQSKHASCGAPFPHAQGEGCRRPGGRPRRGARQRRPSAG